jgi:hypothetical protein
MGAVNVLVLVDLTSLLIQAGLAVGQTLLPPWVSRAVSGAWAGASSGNCPCWRPDLYELPVECDGGAG